MIGSGLARGGPLIIPADVAPKATMQPAPKAPAAGKGRGWIVGVGIAAVAGLLAAVGFTVARKR